MQCLEKLMENKKITIVNATGLYPPQVGGPATRSILLEKYFPNVGIKIKTLKFSIVLWLPHVVRHLVYAEILFWRSIFADAIVAQDAASVGWPASIVTKFLNKPLIIILVGDFAWEQGTGRFGITDTLEDFATRSLETLPKKVAMYKKKQTEILNGATHVVVPSNYLKNIVIKWGVPAEKITVIYNPIEPINLSESKEDLRKKLGLNGRVIFSAGRLVPWKGFDLLIDVVNELKTKYPDLNLCIAGDGPDYEKLKAKSGAVMLGRLSHEDLFQYIKASDLFVLNTGYEGFSHQILEVMALETPIITTSVGGNPEAIISGQEGILVPYNDKEALRQSIEKYLTIPVEFEEMAKRAKEKVKHFTVDRMVGELASVIRKTL